MPTISANSSATATLTDNNSLSVASNAGFASIAVVGVAGPIYSESWGPGPYRKVHGPFKEGATVTITTTSAEVIYDGVNLPNTEALVSGDGIPPNNYTSAVEKAISAAVRLRAMTAAPTVPETVPTNKSNGAVLYIDTVTGNNANAGTAAAPWKDAWKSPGSLSAGATLYLAPEIYEYAATWTDYKAGRVDATNSFGNNFGAFTGTAANPITIRPYYPRGYTTAKPTIRWYALMQAGDWTQESGISGGKVWSAAWAKGGNAYYNVGVAFGAARRMGVAWRQQNTSGAPASLVGADQFSVDATKVYVYVPDGSNPNAYYGEIRIFGGNQQAIYRSFNGLAQYVRIFGIRFEMCMPIVSWASNTTVNADNLEIAYCEFVKTTPSFLKNAQAAASATETVLSIHDNYCEDTHSAVFSLAATGGTAGNTMSWEVYRNRVIRGNVSACYGGALIYNQSTGGTKHIAWGNYGFDCRAGYAGEDFDGAFLYSDVNSDKAIFAGNIAEQCGKPYQFNSMSGLGIWLSNLAIDCGAFGSISNTTGDLKAPSALVGHNEYLLTGRFEISTLPTPNNVGGTGVKSWLQEPVFNVGNSQANTTSNTAYNFGTFTLVNNAAVTMSGSQLIGKAFSFLSQTWTTTLLVAGNAAAGFANALITEGRGGADYTYSARYMHLIGAAADAPAWLAQGATGIARPGVGSPLIGAGASLSVQYQDIGGRNFAAVPTIGCYEVNA